MLLRFVEIEKTGRGCDRSIEDYVDAELYSGTVENSARTESNPLTIYI